MVRKYFIIHLIPLIWFVIHITLVTIDGLSDDYTKADVALIYGNKVNETGEMSDRLKARVVKGLELYRSKVVSKIIVSGGLGIEGFYEAQVMKKYLLEKGVPDSLVIVDDEGIDTYASTINYVTLSKIHKISSVVVVSQFYHISRAKMALRRQGVQDVTGAHADYFEWRDNFSLVREFLAYYKYLFL
jgi:vancomycin permeability regulator SanA